MLKKDSPIPIYYQLEQIIRENIDSGKWEEGDVIPSERLLAEEYEVSRMTIRQAVTNLVQDGLLERQKGRGTFVRRKKLEMPLMQMTSFSEEMYQRGMRPGAEVVSFEEIEMNEQEQEIFNDRRGRRLCRIRLADNQPMAYEVMTVPSGMFPEMPEEVLSRSFYEYAEKAGMKVSGASQSMEAVIADEKLAELLKVKTGDPLLLIRRKSLLEDGRCFEITSSYFRGDRYIFMTHLSR
ncbi:GntR family transcriptional regulator [Alkalicoccus saliphilus]|uniref:Phosphonate metabolism transcriptional regulator PhnF n=1 Tax=Alkalicoccus saliphilus TaxID=200989 RepID=A0A2T4U9G4_9BACI|nr:GntR family transcriptional regulator [Alkalicoccus saliphilus]PTL40035.1 phosphonate metabolism transcriptional regulator PhnF [Alkalicoccus saliphilus]